MCTKKWLEILKIVDSIKVYQSKDDIFYAEVYIREQEGSIVRLHLCFESDSWNGLVKNIYSEIILY